VWSTYSGVIALLLCDYANRNFCLMYGPDCPVMVPVQSHASPDVLDIMVVEGLHNAASKCMLCTQLCPG
jgi:hypothetical protein